jgi:hypothetical protein
MLEPRDQVLEHSFNFEEDIDREELIQLHQENSSIIKNSFYKAVLKKVKIFLVEAVSNVVSASFKFMCDLKLEMHEAKAYASKNIMLNVHSIFRETVKAF